MGTLLRNVIPSLLHDTDGLVFSPLSERVRRGRNHSQWKWKAADSISIDLLLIPSSSSCYHFFFLKDHIFHSSSSNSSNDNDDDFYERIPPNWIILGGLPFIEPEKEKSKKMIVECVFVEEKEKEGTIVFRILKERKDKDIPNTKSTIERTIQSRKDFISLKEMIETLSSFW
jgi:hypothetical protein